jgi:PEP-CTERM motif-containing protein
MMRMQLNGLALAVAVTCGLGFGVAANANTTISTFDNYAFGGVQNAWADPNVTTLTSNPTNYEIESIGFGNGFAGMDPFPTNATGETKINFDVTVVSGDAPNVLALIEDGDGTQHVFRWFVLGPGNHQLSAPLEPFPVSGVDPGGVSYDSFGGGGGTPGFDYSQIKFYQVQVDPHGGTPYDIQLNDLRLTGAGVPEPASLAMFASGAIGMAWLVARRRGR